MHGRALFRPTVGAPHGRELLGLCISLQDQELAPMGRSYRPKRCAHLSSARFRLQALLQPDAVPEWILAQSAHETRTQWIGDKVAGSHQQFPLVSQCVLVECPSPHSTTASQRAIGAARACTLQPGHDARQAIVLAKLQQPMRVVRHQHPCKHLRIPEAATIVEATCCGARGIEIKEQACTINRDGGDVIDLSCDRTTRTSQCSVSFAIGNFCSHGSSIQPVPFGGYRAKSTTRIGKIPDNGRGAPWARAFGALHITPRSRARAHGALLPKHPDSGRLDASTTATGH